MRETIIGTGGMVLLQTLKDAGVEYLFTNPGSAEPGIFAAMADGYHRVRGKMGVVIAHVMGGSYQLAGQLFNTQVAGSSPLVIAGDWASELQDYRGFAPFPGLSQAESMRPITKEARCAYQVHANPAAITVATTRALREATLGLGRPAAGSTMPYARFSRRQPPRRRRPPAPTRSENGLYVVYALVRARPGGGAARRAPGLCLR